MIRQLHSCKTAIPESWVVVAHFYDIESGRMELDARGHKSNYERFDIPISRDGGISDLLDEATRANRRFDVVIAESMSRVARRTFEGISVERQLENADVPLFASNEPITITGSRAQRVLQRRINQSVAEYEVLNTLEQSWAGLCTHVREGWNIGKPCHGYRAKVFKHPNPTKAAKGRTKSRLEPDDAKGETVTQIALWRYYEKLGAGAIADRLNTDLTRYPPPEPSIPGRARGYWSKSSVFDILRNPKYTGYQVFNRRATRSRHGKVNDPRKWVWSHEPQHEPLIPKWMYDEINAEISLNHGSREGGRTTNPNPKTKRRYLLRRRVFCACGRRLEGITRHDFTYYRCVPSKNNKARPDKHPDHPTTVYLREDELTEAILAVYTERLFSPQRHELLAADIDTLDDHLAEQRQAERDRLNRSLSDLGTRQRRLLQQAQTGDPDDPFNRGLRDTYNHLETERNTVLAALTELDAAEQTEPDKPTEQDQGILDALPLLSANLSDAPEDLLLELFEITQLRVELHNDTQKATITITLPEDHAPTISSTVERINSMAETQKTPAQRADASCVELVCTPDGIRTHATGVRGRRPRPLDDGGLLG